MEIKFLILPSLLVAPPVLAQYNNQVKPDVTFGDHNDRFDVSDLVSYQNKYFRADGSIDYRRSRGSKIKHQLLRSGWNPNEKKWLLGSERARKKLARKVKKETEDQLNKLANIILLRMKSARRANEDDFAFHDNMESDGGDIYDFNENLHRFKKLSSGKSDTEDTIEPKTDYRRIGTVPDSLNYAFPIEVQIKGYLMMSQNR